MMFKIKEFLAYVACGIISGYVFFLMFEEAVR